MRILLVRHGRSAHVQRGLLDLAAFRRWRELYEVSGIDEDERAPAELMTVAATSSIVASTAPRALHSARLLGRDVITSPLLTELALPPPDFVRLRMPLRAWALVCGIRHAISPAERQRADDAAAWLIALAKKHDSVLAVTHGSFRSLLAAQLVARGWPCRSPKRWHHWSVWTFAR